MTTRTRLTFAAAIFGAAIFGAATGFGVTASQAGNYGNAPWCAVQNFGAGEVVWDCEYRSVEECQPQVIAGNRGFCNPNPSWTPPLSVAPSHRKRHRT
jgi:hypothetical protein